MSILVLQLIIKQWNKCQRTQQHADERAKIASHYPINFPPDEQLKQRMLG